MSDKSLCCVINPINSCWKCSSQLCKEHSEHEAAEHYWCETCFDLDEDSFLLIRHMQERIEDAGDCFDEIKTELEIIADHPARSKTCRADMWCDELVSLADDADKLIRRKYLNKTF